MATVTLQDFHGRFALTASTVTIGTNAIPIAAGYYYTTGYTSESTAQLCETLQANIRAATGSVSPNANVVYSFATGRITIQLDSAQTITWTTAAMQSRLGFTGTQSGSATYTATNQPKCVWRPSRAPASVPLSLARFWDTQSTSRQTRAKDGAVHTVAGHAIYDATIEYQALPSTDVLQVATADNSSLEEFYAQVIVNGQPFRVYPDRTVYTASGVYTATWGEESCASVAGAAKRTVRQYAGYYDVTLPMWRVV